MAERHDRRKKHLSNEQRRIVGGVHQLLEQLKSGETMHQNVVENPERFVYYQDIVPTLLKQPEVVLVKDIGEDGMPENMAQVSVGEVSGVRIVLVPTPGDATAYFKSRHFKRRADVVLAPGTCERVLFHFHRQVKQLIDHREKTT